MNRYRIGDTKEIQNQRNASNIINRREIEPLLIKALEVVKSYERAVDCEVSVIDQTGQPIHDPSTLACGLCLKCHPAGSYYQCQEPGTYPCLETHIQGVNEAQRMGGSYIYVCDMGFIYWASPIYSSGRLGGGLFAGGILSVDRQQMAQKLSLRCRGTVSDADILAALEEIPVKNSEEIGALAQMLLLCADQISRGPEGYETVKYNSGEEPRKEAPPPREEDKKNFRIGYSLDKERMLLAALRRGDNEAGRQILNQILENLFTSNPHNFNFIQLRAIELVVLLSREAVTVDNSEDSNQLDKNNRYLRHIQEAQNIEDLTAVMHTIVERMGSQIFSFQGVRHASALRKAERFIWENYTRKICLQEVADASGLSAPYFSTIFKEEMGENLSNYLNRLRVEKASSMLTETNLALSEIAGACGFEDQSWFSKIFKSYTGVSPGKYRETGMGLEEPDPGGTPVPGDT